jgi:hypothetical protein
VLSTRLTTHLTSGLLSAAGVSATAGALVAVVPIRRDRCTPGLSLIRAAPLLEAIGHRNMVRCRADTERIVHCKSQKQSSSSSMLVRRAFSSILALVAVAHGAEDATPLLLKTFTGGLAGWVSSSVDKYTGALGPIHHSTRHSLHHAVRPHANLGRAPAAWRDRRNAGSGRRTCVRLHRGAPRGRVE